MNVVFSLMLSLLLLACAPQQVREQSATHKAAEINVQLGITYMNKGYHDIALGKLQRALRQNNNLASAHNAIAVLYGLLGDIERAEHHFNQALYLQPEYPEAHNNYGQFLCQQGEAKKADQQFQMAIKSPLYVSAHKAYLNAGLCMKQDHDKAQEYFKKALGIHPEWGKALLEMALLQHEMGNDSHARAYLLRHDAVSQPQAGALWLGVLVEYRLDDQKAMKVYQQRLQALFPKSTQAEKSRRRLFE